MSAVTSKPAIACFHCKKDHDSATAFLLMCAKCQRAWHNGCHIPPVSSEELLKRYDADRAGKRAAGIRSWQCRTCTKRSRPEPSGSSIPSTVPTRCSDTPPARTTTQSQPAIAGQVCLPRSQGELVRERMVLRL
ncbi:hypothetical protein C8Q80DRAFT_1095234 [Daedaleopsis nitida]|nr:hypothetical protein C8Q80DRAFT_1095234 [Daedaleopsis nitida]